ncbi:MAG: hypothetical protein KA807_11985 [Prolixibacteraceae bacterium]|nr:hypothetical protein [Prolixibacteraceae bacterium]
MKQILFLLTLTVLAIACSITRKSDVKVYDIKVVNKMNNSPIDSVQVNLVTIIDSKDVFEDIKYTDKNGRCKFSKDNNPLAQYQVRAMKDGFLGYYDKSYRDLDRSYSFINSETGDNIILYLTNDSLNHESYWAERTIRYNVDTLIGLLKSNNYPLRSEFPLLLWEDIPGLLGIGNDNTKINHYPVNVASSSYEKGCYLGIVSLWFIESARITELKKTSDPFKKFPSLTPTLQDKNDPELTSNNIEIMGKAYQAYMKWWDKVKMMDKELGCKINPLENTDLVWR